MFDKHQAQFISNPQLSKYRNPIRISRLKASYKLLMENGNLNELSCRGINQEACQQIKILEEFNKKIH